MNDCHDNDIRGRVLELKETDILELDFTLIKIRNSRSYKKNTVKKTIKKIKKTYIIQVLY